MSYLSELRTNWRPLAAATAGLSAGLSLTAYTNAVMAPQFLAEFGWSRSEFALTGVIALLTFVFVLLILCVTSKPENSTVAGLVIGLTLTVVHIIGIPFTGTSVNPARSFGPALLTGGVALQQVWVFFVGPLVGAAVAALFYRFVMVAKKD